MVVNYAPLMQVSKNFVPMLPLKAVMVGPIINCKNFIYIDKERI